MASQPNPACRRRTFAETPLTLLAPRARRTRRLSEAQARVGIACGGAGGARLLAHLHMPASRATVLRLVTHLPMPDAPAPIRVGIDDWAIRKGSRYGTIVVDLDRRHIIDLLPDRTALTVADWLERHPSVELVARDRSTEYARGASLGAPQAQQGADRWHLLTNMRQAVERWLHGGHARLCSLPLLPGSTVRPARRNRAFARSTTELEAGAQSRMRWQAIYDEVRRRHTVGEPLLAIARAMGLARATVRGSTAGCGWSSGGPVRIYQGILAEPGQSRAVDDQRVSALLAGLEAHGSLRGCKGWFVPNAERQEHDEMTADRSRARRPQDPSFELRCALCRAAYQPHSKRTNEVDFLKLAY